MITKKLQSKDGFVLNKKISSANFNFFKKHGYIVIRDVLNKKYIKIVLDSIKKNIKSVDLKISDILLMNLDLVHRSGKNISSEFRMSLLGRYHNMIKNDFNSKR